MRIAVRIIELCGTLQMPAALTDYDAVRVYCKVRGEIKGYTIIWNAHKAAQNLEKRYPDDFGSWLMLSNIFFSPLGMPPIDQNVIKGLLCAKAGITAERLDEEYSYTSPVLPPLTASIVIPTKDRPEDLARALEHLTTHKTAVTHEIIIVDNNPASGLTAPVVQRFPEVKYIAESRPGVGYARNAGTLAARGDIVIATDDDVVVGEGWLDYLVAPFADHAVGAVTSMILPYELETPAQQMFENSRPFYLAKEEVRFDSAYFNQKTFPDLNRFGSTSSAAFRYSTFADPKIGPFEVALGAGTITRGGGDIYQFYRILAAGFTIVYSPKAFIYHRHRDNIARLRKQYFGIGSGFVARASLLITRNKDRRVFRLLWHDLPLFHWRHLKRSLTDKDINSMDIVIMQILGYLVGPFNLWRSLRACRKLGNFTTSQFAEQIIKRELLLKEEVV